MAVVGRRKSQDYLKEYAQHGNDSQGWDHRQAGAREPLPVPSVPVRCVAARGLHRQVQTLLRGRSSSLSFPSMKEPAPCRDAQLGCCETPMRFHKLLQLQPASVATCRAAPCMTSCVSKITPRILNSPLCLACGAASETIPCWGRISFCSPYSKRAAPFLRPRAPLNSASPGATCLCAW